MSDAVKRPKPKKLGRAPRFDCDFARALAVDLRSQCPSLYAFGGQGRPLTVDDAAQYLEFFAKHGTFGRDGTLERFARELYMPGAFHALAERAKATTRANGVEASDEAFTIDVHVNSRNSMCQSAGPVERMRNKTADDAIAILAREYGVSESTVLKIVYDSDGPYRRRHPRRQDQTE